MKALPAAAAGVAIVSVTASIVDTIRVVRTERQKRRDIAVNRDRTIAAIKVAGARVSKNIAEGKYDGQSMHSILYDELEFETIVAYNEMYN